MTRERHPQPELSAFDYAIRRYTNAANAHRGLALHFAEMAEQDQKLAQYWTEERDRALGATALDNIVAMPQPSGDSVA